MNIVPIDSTVTIDASKSKSIHYDVIEIFEEFTINAKEKNIKVNIQGLDQNTKHDSPMAILEKTVKEFNLEPALAN